MDTKFEKTKKSRRIGIYVDQDDLQKLKIILLQNNLTFSEWFREIVKAELQNFEQINETPHIAPTT